MNSNLKILVIMAIILDFLKGVRVRVEWEWGVEKWWMGGGDRKEGNGREGNKSS
jgi:hypothetical protein